MDAMKALKGVYFALQSPGVEGFMKSCLQVQSQIAFPMGLPLNNSFSSASASAFVAVICRRETWSGVHLRTSQNGEAKEVETGEAARFNAWKACVRVSPHTQIVSRKACMLLFRRL